MFRTFALAAGLTVFAAAPVLAHCPAGYYYSSHYRTCRLSSAYYYPPAPAGVVGGAVGTAGYVAGSAVNTAGAVAGAAVNTAGAIAGGALGVVTGR